MRWMTTASATARFQSKSRSASAAEAVPANEGLMRPIKLIAPPGTIVNALPPAAVAGGNVETSQRIVDVLFRALAHAAPERIPAASSGSMSNVTVGGYDSMRARHFSYYETIAGGAGGAEPAGRVGDPYSHDEHAEHSDRGARSVLPIANY